MCFIERETQTVILKFRGIFLWRETMVKAHGMKSDKKPFLCQIYAIVWWKIVYVVMDRYFSLFVKGLKIFLNSMLLLIVVNCMFSFHQYLPTKHFSFLKFVWIIRKSWAWRTWAFSWYQNLWEVSFSLEIRKVEAGLFKYLQNRVIINKMFY